MTFRPYLLPLMASALLGAGICTARTPNIVVLYSDDAGFADFGFQPDCRPEMRKLTPNIDRIAKEGARFTDAYMSGCVCSPSRAGLMTGIYQQRYGYDNNLPPDTKDGLPLNVTFTSKRLQKLGYKTGLIGKWHLGYPDEFHPNERGFDWFYGLLQGSRPYHEMPKASPHRVILENRKPTKEEGYVTDRFGDAACRFIREHKEEPFYLFVSFTAPHGPLQPRKEDLKRLAHIDEKRRKNYAGLIVSLDDNVGKVLECLDQEKLTNDTVVIFTNDNGGQTATGANNFPLNGKKGTLYEGGVRVPWSMRWPEKIKPGSVVNDPVIALDLTPSFLTLADGKVENDWNLDGVSFIDRVLGKTDELPQRPLFWRQHGGSGDRAMRDGHWKLLHRRRSKEKPELFDLSKDIGESINVADQHSDVVKGMLAKLNAWESQMTTPRWGPGAPEKKK